MVLKVIAEAAEGVEQPRSEKSPPDPVLPAVSRMQDEANCAKVAAPAPDRGSGNGGQHLSGKNAASGKPGADNSAHGAIAAEPEQALERKLLKAVNSEIALHRKLFSSESYLQRAVTSVYNPAASTLNDLVIVKEALEKDHGQSYESVSSERARTITEKIKADQETLAKEQLVSHVAAGALTVAPLFVPGPVGWLGSAALSALNNASPADNAEKQIADAALGAGKGVLLKGAFAVSGRLPGGFVTRTAFLGPAQRAVDSGLKSETYVDSSTGAVDVASGLRRIASSTFNPYSLAADAGSLLLSGGTAVGVNYLTAGALGRNVLFGTMATGSIYGFNSSVSYDVKNHLEHDTPITLSGVLSNGLESAAISMVTAVPGGLMAAHEAYTRNDALARVQAPESPEPGEHNNAMDFNGEYRSYRVYYPETADPNVKLPVLAVIHGTGGSAKEIAETTGINKLANDGKFIAVYPEGEDVLGDPSHRVWHIPVWGLSDGARQANDVNFIAAVIDKVQKQYNGDPERTLVAGMSAGGTLAGLVKTMHPEKVAAVAIVAGAHVGPEMLPPAGTPTLILHSAEDNVVTVNGGTIHKLFGLLPVGTSFDSLKDTEKVKVHQLGKVRVRIAKDVKEIIVNKGGGHSWNISKGQGEVPSASRLVANFIPRVHSNVDTRRISGAR